MAVFDTTSALRGTGRMDGRFSHLFHRLVDRFVQWNNARITRNALSQLSAHELNDIGLTPGDIDALTRR